MSKKKIILFSNTSWYLYNFRSSLIEALERDAYDVVLIAPEDKFSERLRQMNVKLYHIGVDRKGLNPFSQLKILRDVLRIYQKERPDIVYNFTIKCVVLGSIAAMLLGIRRRINSVDGLGTIFTSNNLKSKILRPLLKFLLKTAASGNRTRLILQNPDNLEIFTRDISPDNTCNISLIRGAGVSAKKYSAREINESFQSPKKILFASRLLWAKGLQNFVDAAKAITQEGDYEFLIAGEPDTGSTDAVPKSVLTGWEEQGWVTLLGHVDDMPGLLSTVDLVVLPSVYGEGVPTILIEAAASAIPLVAFDVPGSREIVVNGINGYLVERENQDALINAIRNVFQDKDHYMRMAELSRNHFLDHFEETNVIQRTIDIIANTGEAGDTGLAV